MISACADRRRPRRASSTSQGDGGSTRRKRLRIRRSQPEGGEKWRLGFGGFFAGDVEEALAVGAGLEGATHSAVRHAVADGVTANEMEHVAVLAITTLGLPAATRGLTWIKDPVTSNSDPGEEVA